MGNKPVKLGLRVDQTTYQAGSVLRGCVYLSVTAVQNRVQGVHLKLEGTEVSVVVRANDGSHNGYHHHHHHHRHGHEDSTRVERSTTTLVKMDVPLTTFTEPLQSGQYEYPFEWELPIDLPSSMRCQKGESHCEISYQLAAYLYGGSNVFGMSSNEDVRSSTTLCVLAKSSETQPKPIQMEVEQFPIRHCCARKGFVKLGWDLDSAVACPNHELNLGIVGCNESSVEVKHVRVRWMESIGWNARGQSEHVERILDESILPVSQYAEWQPTTAIVGHHRLVPPASFQNNGTYSSLVPSTQQQQRQPCRLLSLQLHIPPDARDSHQGRLIHVRHTLVVVAVTEGHCCITSPESAARVEIQRRAPVAVASEQAAAAYESEWQAENVTATTTSTTATVVEPSAPHAAYDDGNTTYVQANVLPLPEDWSAQTAEVVTLTASSATLLDRRGGDEATTTTTTPQAGAVAVPTQGTTTGVATAQEEATVLSTTMPSTTIDTEDNHVLSQMQTCLSQSCDPLQLVQDRWASNPTFAAEIQNCSPHLYVRLLQSVPPNHASQTPQVARRLAEIMDVHFTCNHVLACLWALPGYLRFDVLREVAPLASDLAKNQHYVEQQLDANELLHFRAALMT